MQHVGVKAFERLKLTNVRNREAYECEWRPCQHALPTLHRWCGRRVLYTEDEAFFAHALRKRGLTRDELYVAPLWNGLASCCHVIQPTRESMHRTGMLILPVHSKDTEHQHVAPPTHFHKTSAGNTRFPTKNVNFKNQPH